MAEETRIHHQRLMLRIKRWVMASTVSGMPFDLALCLIVNKIMLFSSDGLELDNPDEAERVREGYCSLLWRYLEARHGWGKASLAARVGEGLMVGSLAKEVAVISESERRKAGFI